MTKKMKFILQIYADKWIGNRCYTGRKIKQKTFYADDWDEAEMIQYKLMEDWGLEGYSSQLSVLK